MIYYRYSVILLMFIVVLTTPSFALGQEEPTIAPEIGRLVAEQGVEAAQARFEELSTSGSLNAGVEIQGLYTLMSAYMQAGNTSAGEAVANMASQLTQNMMTQSMPGMVEQMEAHQKAEEAARAQEEANRTEKNKLEQKRQAQSRGKSRDDLERFKGLYGEKNPDRMGKTIFVAVSCDGYLVTGPMWADVGAWWMRSASEMVFTYSDSFTSISMEFTLDENDEVDLMKHDINGIGSPLEWKKSLPNEYEECIERPRR